MRVTDMVLLAALNVGAVALASSLSLYWPNHLTSVLRANSASDPKLGREVSVLSHMEDGFEYRVPLDELLEHGKLLFEANWTEQEGGGRPLTKGTGRPLADVTRPLTGMRAFNRLSAPDA